MRRPPVCKDLSLPMCLEGMWRSLSGKSLEGWDAERAVATAWLNSDLPARRPPPKHPQALTDRRATYSQTQLPKEGESRVSPRLLTLPF